MNLKINAAKMISLLAILFCFSAQSALADIEFTARGAAVIPWTNFSSFVSTPAWMTAFDATMGVSSLVQFGATYDRTFLSYKNNGGNGTENFYGGIVRLGFFGGPFVDGQAGVCSRDGFGHSISWGAGVGYRMSISPLFDFSPRIGYRVLPDSNITRTMFDAGVMLTLNLL